MAERLDSFQERTLGAHIEAARVGLNAYVTSQWPIRELRPAHVREAQAGLRLAALSCELGNVADAEVELHHARLEAFELAAPDAVLQLIERAYVRAWGLVDAERQRATWMADVDAPTATAVAS